MAGGGNGFLFMEKIKTNENLSNQTFTTRYTSIVLITMAKEIVIFRHLNASQRDAFSMKFVSEDHGEFRSKKKTIVRVECYVDPSSYECPSASTGGFEKLRPVRHAVE